ncbi:phosphatase PAP2 family protein [Patescibacteria group bacterium]|nr:phosphatase PAP2 family protein [Patescibacteria group bacterium]
MKKPEGLGKRIFWCIVFAVIGGGLYLLANSWGRIIGAFDIQFKFEKNIPFIPWTILVYYLVFPYLASVILTVSRYEDFLKVVSGYWLIILVSVAIFFMFPTTMPRPDEATPQIGLLGVLFRAIYLIDGPNNLFPSLHVSSVSYIGLVNWRFSPRFRILGIIIAVLISVSTLTVKQHAIVDIFGGLVLGLTIFLVIFKLIGKKAT